MQLCKDLFALKPLRSEVYSLAIKTFITGKLGISQHITCICFFAKDGRLEKAYKIAILILTSAYW